MTPTNPPLTRKEKRRYLREIRRIVQRRIDERWADGKVFDESRRPTPFELIVAQYDGIDDMDLVTR